MIFDRARWLVPSAQLLLAGGIAALGFAPLNLWPLPILALAYLMQAGFHAGRTREAFLTGWLFGLGHFLVSLCWVPDSFTHQDKMPAWLGWLGLVLVSAYFALYPGLACALAWRLARRSAAGWALLLAASWMLCEWARAGVLGGFAWNPLAVIWLALPPLEQGLKWIGPYGMSGLVMLAAGGVWLGLLHRWRTTAGVTLVAVLLGMLLGRLTQPAANVPEAAGVPVRIVQPNINEEEKHDLELADTNLQRYVSLSLDAHPAPRLLLWPEGALADYVEYKAALRVELARLLGPGDILLTGGPSAILDPKGNDDNTIFHNSVFALDGRGRLLWHYDKAHLVPFGEFLPARPLLSAIGLSRLVPGEGGDFSSGPGPRTFEVPGFVVDGKPLRVAVQICYEIIFPGQVVDETHRPDFIFNPSNDAWFGPWGPPQHLAQARMRAIEEGLPIIRATPNGISVVIAPDGQVLKQVPHGQEGTIDATVPAALPPTVFARFGLWTSTLVGLLIGGLGLAMSRGLRMPRMRTAVLEQPPA
jgi:apolipoprotein N-acyltransferase